MLLLVPPFIRADTRRSVLCPHRKVPGKSVHRRVRQMNAVSLKVTIVHTPITKREWGRAVCEGHLLVGTQGHEPGVDGVDCIRCIRGLHARHGHRACLHLGRVDYRGIRFNHRRGGSRRRRVAIVAACDHRYRVEAVCQLAQFVLNTSEFTPWYADNFSVDQLVPADVAYKAAADQQRARLAWLTERFSTSGWPSAPSG